MTRTKSKRSVHFAATSQLILMPNADRNWNWYSAADKAKFKAKFKRETLQHTQNSRKQYILALSSEYPLVAFLRTPWPTAPVSRPSFIFLEAF